MGGRQNRLGVSVALTARATASLSTRASTQVRAAEGATFTDVGEGDGYVVEPERAVDVDADVTRDAQIGQRLEMGPALPSRRARPSGVG
jgi:hypothetical protein